MACLCPHLLATSPLTAAPSACRYVQAGLENFLLLLLANPYIRADATLRVFLTQRGTAEFEQAKKAAAQGVGADPASNPGLARWFGVLCRLSLPVDADAACRELAVHCAETEMRLVNTLGACSRYYEAAKGLSESLKAVRDAVSDFHASCNTAAAGLSDTLAPLRSATVSLGGRLKKSADAFANAHDLSVFAPNEIQIFLLDGLVAEIHRVRGLKALLEVREAAQREYAAAWQAQDKLNFQEKSLRDKGQAPKADALAPKVAEAVAGMKRLKERLDDISKGLLHIEAERLARTRVDRIVAMVRLSHLLHATCYLCHVVHVGHASCCCCALTPSDLRYASSLFPVLCSQPTCFERSLCLLIPPSPSSSSF